MHTRRLTGSTKTPDQRAVNNQYPHRNSTPRRLIHLHVLVPLYLLVRFSEILAAAAAIIIIQTKWNKERFLFLFLQKLDSNSIGEISYSTAAEDHDLPNKNKTKKMKKQQGTYYSRRRAAAVSVQNARLLSLSLPLSLYRATGSSPAAHSSTSVSCSNLLFSFSVWDPDPPCLATPPLSLFVFSSLLTT